jgi:hypothetical protein
VPFIKALSKQFSFLLITIMGLIMTLQINFITKFSEKDNFEYGCYGAHDMSDIHVRIEAENIQELRQKFADILGIELKEVFINEETSRLECSVYENYQGFKASDELIEVWKKGEIDIYHCNYQATIYFVEIYKFK